MCKYNFMVEVFNVNSKVQRVEFKTLEEAIKYSESIEKIGPYVCEIFQVIKWKK